jgi:hypothetical protein
MHEPSDQQRGLRCARPPWAQPLLPRVLPEVVGRGQSGSQVLCLLPRNSAAAETKEGEVPSRSCTRHQECGVQLFQISALHGLPSGAASGGPVLQRAYIVAAALYCVAYCSLQLFYYCSFIFSEYPVREQFPPQLDRLLRLRQGPAIGLHGSQTESATDEAGRGGIRHACTPDGQSLLSLQSPPQNGQVPQPLRVHPGRQLSLIFNIFIRNNQGDCPITVKPAGGAIAILGLTTHSQLF